MTHTHARPTSFDRVAGLYDRARPGYPDAVIRELLSAPELPPGSRVLEIGSGTGRLTVPLARAGLRVTALEPGPQLAERTRRHVPEANVVVERFEDFDIEQRAFDAVTSAQAFHWIDTSVSLQRCAEALREGGLLALIWTLDRSANSDFWRATTALYDRFFPDDGDLPEPPLADRVQRIEAAIDGHPAFGSPGRQSYPWEREFEHDAFIDLLGTHSNVLALAAEDRAAFLAGVSEVIDRQGGRVTRTYETVLVSARRL